MSYKKHIKSGIKLVVESDGNLVTLIIRASKAQIYRVIDVLLPDDVEVQERRP